MIRRATSEDLEAITRIYNQAIASRTATADTEPTTPALRAQWLAAQDHARTPVFVLEQDGAVWGYCYLSAYRAGRRALEQVAEISYYVDFTHHRAGVGGRLVAHAIEAARALGYRHLLAILLSCNAPSISLLKKHGFSLWGTLPDVAHIDGSRYSHLYYGRELR